MELFNCKGIASLNTHAASGCINVIASCHASNCQCFSIMNKFLLLQWISMTKTRVFAQFTNNDSKLRSMLKLCCNHHILEVLIWRLVRGMIAYMWCALQHVDPFSNTIQIKFVTTSVFVPIYNREYWPFLCIQSIYSARLGWQIYLPRVEKSVWWHVRGQCHSPC